MNAVRGSLVALAICVLGASGCGTEDVQPNAVANAAEVTTEARTARMSMRISVPGPRRRPVEMSGDGAIDMEQQRGRLRFDLWSLGGEGVLEVLFDDLVVWMRAPEFDRRLPDGVHWVKIDMAEASESVGVDLAQFAQAGNDPMRQLDYLRAVGDVRKVGRGRVKDDRTTHHRGVVDLRRYPDLLPEDERERARESVDVVVDLVGRSRFPVDVWIDEEELVRRMRMTMPVPRGAAERGLMKMEYELWDFGVDVEVEPPAEDDVADITAAAGRGRAERP